MTDLIIHNAKVWTVDPRRPLAEAVAIAGGRIEAVGSNAEVRRLAGPRTEVIDATGRLVLPGFIDAHVHLLSGGLTLLSVDLRGAKDERDFADVLRRHVAKTPPGEWITRGQWDHETWPSRRRPTRQLIDPFTRQHPVFVNRLDGHIALANSLALKLAGVGRETRDPAGGRIERDADGEPTGILIDNALELVQRAIPSPGEERLRRAAKAAMSRAADVGVTSVHCPVTAEEFGVLRALCGGGELTTRVYAMPELPCWRRMKVEGWLPYQNPEEGEKKATQAEEAKMRGRDPRGTQGRDPYGQAALATAMLRAGCVKLFADGSLGAKSALFLEPYGDDPSSCGLALFSRDELFEHIRQIDAASLQVALHAIGDKAVRWALDAFEAVRQNAAVCGAGERRHRIEHAQMVQPADRARFARLGVIASIQPSHCIDDMRWVATRMGERTRFAYPYRSLLDSGARVALGTDWPVETLDPMLTLYAAVTRERPPIDEAQGMGGPIGGWHGEERVTIEEAIRDYTLGAACAEFQEHEKGSIGPGKLADMVVLSRDILTVPPREIVGTRVETAVLGGKVLRP